MSTPAIHIKNLSKAYKLGEYTAKTFADEVKNIFRKRAEVTIGRNDRADQNSTDNYVYALKGLNFTLNQGEVVGVIGKNGAGKSTTMNILCGVINQTEGMAFIDGIDIRENPVEAKKLIGFLPQKAPLHFELTLQYFAQWNAGPAK